MDNIIESPNIRTWWNESAGKSVEVAQILQLGIYPSEWYKSFSSEKWIGTIDHHWWCLFADNEHAIELYRQLWISLLECPTGEILTENLKLLFEEFEANYSVLRSLDDWPWLWTQQYVEMLQLSDVIDKWSWKHHIPYLWYLKIKDNSFKRSHHNKTICMRLPLLRDGKLIRMRCSPASPKTSFDAPDNRACPIGLFDTNLDLSK